MTTPTILTLDHVIYLSRVFTRKTLSTARQILNLDAVTESTVNIDNDSTISLPAIAKILDVRCLNPDSTLGMPLRITLTGINPNTMMSQSYTMDLQGRLCITGAFAGVILTNPNDSSSNLDPINCSLVYS